ncbi:hypothetical protein J7E83_00630 [Arthrobacter sp. ISL-48]|uniref:hypothetical protein n=1 Tax=Arthrobacter sp. ISL-48 TaxID=2819110 RepID=UPI001BE74EEC|nr:hypothetical protein [Arthrobacter sp. ISL-48]MBT2530650.1 hypothetical protein [Arthrobacter sp. ISL-48]
MAPRPTEGPAFPAVRLFAGFAGFGAGAVNLALSSSLLAGPAGSGAPRQVALGILAGLWGASLILTAGVFLNGARIPASRWWSALLVAAAGIHAAALLMTRGSASSLNISHLAALLLTLMIIASAAWLRRHATGYDDGVAPAAGRPGRLLLAAFAGALLVAGIATPGLAASTAGQYAVPHGQHGDPPLHSNHDGH